MTNPAEARERKLDWQELRRHARKLNGADFHDWLIRQGIVAPAPGNEMEKAEDCEMRATREQETGVALEKARFEEMAEHIVCDLCELESSTYVGRVARYLAKLFPPAPQPSSPSPEAALPSVESATKWLLENKWDLNQKVWGYSPMPKGKTATLQQLLTKFIDYLRTYKPEGKRGEK